MRNVNLEEYVTAIELTNLMYLHGNTTQEPWTVVPGGIKANRKENYNMFGQKVSNPEPLIFKTPQAQYNQPRDEEDVNNERFVVEAHYYVPAMIQEIIRLRQLVSTEGVNNCRIR